MIHDRKTCMEGWTEEYHGYLMSSKFDEIGQRNYICVDHAPEADRSGYLEQGGATLCCMFSIKDDYNYIYYKIMWYPLHLFIQICSLLDLSF